MEREACKKMSNRKRKQEKRVKSMEKEGQNTRDKRRFGMEKAVIKTDSHSVFTACPA